MDTEHVECRKGKDFKLGHYLSFPVGLALVRFIEEIRGESNDHGSEKYVDKSW
jgi:hypothetical protein